MEEIYMNTLTSMDASVELCTPISSALLRSFHPIAVVDRSGLNRLCNLLKMGTFVVHTEDDEEVE